MAFKIVIGDPNTKKSYQFELENTTLLIGKKTGEKVDGSILGIDGYELEITGGSDTTGAPMRKDVEGSASRRLLLSKGIGFRAKKKGERRKKRVHGNTISEKIVQVNMKVIKSGPRSLDQLLRLSEKQEEAKEKPREEKPSEKPAEEQKAKEKEEPQQAKEA